MFAHAHWSGRSATLTVCIAAGFLVISTGASAQAPPVGPGKCYGNCGSPPAPTYKPAPSHNPYNAKKREASRLNRLAVSIKSDSVANVMRKMRLYRRAMMLNPRQPVFRENYGRMFGVLGKFAYFRKEYRRAIFYWQTQLRYASGQDRRTALGNIGHARRQLQVHAKKPKAKYKGKGAGWTRRWCGLCRRALHNNLYYGIEKTAGVVQFVAQSQAKYLNCIRKTRYRCCKYGGRKIVEGINKRCTPPHKGSFFFKQRIKNYISCIKIGMFQLQSFKIPEGWKAKHCPG